MTQRNRYDEQGMALLLVLGLLTVVLMIGIGFAFSTLVERQSSAASADLVRCRLLAESGVERVLGIMQTQYDDVFPSDQFFAGADTSQWQGQRLIASINPNDQADIEQALNLRNGGLDLTPAALIDANVGWLPMYSKRSVGGNSTQVLTGRLAYLVVDESGKLDPNAVVSAGGEAEDETPTTGKAHLPRTGATVAEIALADAGVADADRLRPQTVQGGTAGAMPKAGVWSSLAHIARATGIKQSAFNSMVQTLFPHSREPETFWRDANGNGSFDNGEEQDRVDLAGSLSAIELYELFVGPDKASAVDDCAWLKETDNSAWVQQWRSSAGLSVVQARQRLAAQVAVNVVDYADADHVSTLAYLDAAGVLHMGSGGVFQVAGTEQNWGISEVAMRVRAQVHPEDAINENYGAGNDIAESDAAEVTFEITNGTVTTTGEDYNVNVTVLGAAMSYGGAYDMPVTACIKIGNTTYQPWGDWTKALDGNVNDGANPRSFALPDPVPANTAISVQAKTFVKNGGNSNNNNGWSVYRTVNSTPATPRVRVLRDGDAVPEVQGYLNQGAIAGFVAAYVDTATNTMDLSPTQAIYLFEFTSNLNSVSADYQDIVLLVDLAAQPDGTGSYEVTGTAEVNPNNNTEKSFQLTREGKADITRDTLHDQGATWSYDSVAEGDTVTSIRFKPKANQNTMIINGKTVSLANNTVYTLTGTSLYAKIYNDGPGNGNGKKMGQWQIEFGGEGVAMTPDVATCLSFKPGFKAEAFHPFLADADSSDPLGKLTIDYAVTALSTQGKTVTANGSMNISVATIQRSLDGGTLASSDAYVEPSDWATLEGAFTAGGDTSYRITSAKITGIKLHNAAADIIDQLPPAGGNAYFVAWQQLDGVNRSRNFYAGVKAHDPLHNNSSSADPDFASYWTAWPDASSLAAFDELIDEDIGSLAEGYQSAAYCDVSVANQPFQRLGELGRVHSYQPKRSLRLWSAAATEQSGHDAHILDLFKLGSASESQGRVNINSRRRAVLEALFNGATTVDATSAASAVLSARDQAAFASIGDLFGGVAGISGSDASADDIEELAVERLAELVSTRTNYFTILVVAQAIKDVAGISYDSNDDGKRDAIALHGQLDVRRDADDNVVGYVDKIQGEQKVMAVLRRDALTKVCTVQNYEYLND